MELRLERTTATVPIDTMQCTVWTVRGATNSPIVGAAAVAEIHVTAGTAPSSIPQNMVDGLLELELVKSGPQITVQSTDLLCRVSGTGCLARAWIGTTDAGLWLVMLIPALTGSNDFEALVQEELGILDVSEVQFLDEGQLIGFSADGARQ